MRVLFALLLLIAAAMPAWAQDGCRVLDPELLGAYKGGCKDGLAEGYGEARGSAEYRGEFHAGRKNGRGIKIWPNGDRYEGRFVEDRKDGVGTYSWGPNGPWAGERYQGDFRADKREGFGIYTGPSGDKYVGEWANDAIVGAPTPGMLARSRQEVEAEVAMRPGTKVCRQMQVGIAERDLIQGVVVESEQGKLRVRIEQPGHFEQVLNGVKLARGAVVTDAVSEWMPCL